MTQKKCKICYNKTHRQDLCMDCEWLFEEIPKNESLVDRYKPMINNVKEV